MRVLLVNPEFPDSYWSGRHALRFSRRRSLLPPLGLITVAALLPAEWEVRLKDLAVEALSDADLLGADVVMLSGMLVQRPSLHEVISRCRRLGVRTVVGGPYATALPQELGAADTVVVGEAEHIVPVLATDLASGRALPIYREEGKPDMTASPVPRYDLLRTDAYHQMSLQYSRGCPYDCEFCSITMLNGRRPRPKSVKQFIAELDRLYELGWREPVSVVDDNFIGNKRILKTETLPAMIEWSKQKDYPFKFITEASINLSDDEELMNMMVDAGFNSIFVGIETPNGSSLEECGKAVNLRRDLVTSVKKLQKKGFIVSGGFIVGFDNDNSTVFEEQINFIQRTGIVTAMVGLLNAPIGTKLFKRLNGENRLLSNFTGNNMDGSINFIPKMKYADLMAGYHNIIRTIYSQKDYYHRIKNFLRNYELPAWNSNKLSLREIKAFLRSLWLLGIFKRGRRYYWKIFAYSLIKYPHKFPLAITMAVYGYHFRRIAATI